MQSSEHCIYAPYPRISYGTKKAYNLTDEIQLTEG